MITVAEIADRLNDQAATLAPELLPNGRRAGAKWMASGIADTGRSESLFVHLSGARIGHWCDMGNAAPGEDKGDMLDLLRLVRGYDARGAIEAAKALLGIQDEFRPGREARPDPEALARRAEEARARAEKRQAEEDAERALKIRRAKGLWLHGVPIAGTMAESYLLGRGIAPSIACANVACGAMPTGSGDPRHGRAVDISGVDPQELWPGSLRFHPEVWHKDERCKLPAMVSAIYCASGEQIGTHRIYLQASPGAGARKLNSPNAKLVLGTMWGGFVPIAKGASGRPMAKLPEGEPVYVTEGIEDALVVRMMRPEARVVAAISLANMGAIVLPPAARELVLVCDRDQNAKAQEQLERAIAAQQARGLAVRLVMPPAQFDGIVLKGVPIKDVNDWWCAIEQDRKLAKAQGQARGKAA